MSDLYAELPLAADFYARNRPKVIRRHQSALLSAADTCHALHTTNKHSDEILREIIALTTILSLTELRSTVFTRNEVKTGF